MDKNIIFIDTFTNLNGVSNTSKSNYFSLSLKEQFEKIKEKFIDNGLLNIENKSLSSFLEDIFPSNFEKKYYFSCPNFKREIREINKNEKSIKFLNNVVIRPEITEGMKKNLPNNCNVILIGDISEGERLKKINIKGIQIIDQNIVESSINDKEITAKCCNNTLGRTNWTIYNVGYENSIFTPEFIDELIQKCYPLSDENIKLFQRKYDEWMEYIYFREEWLKSNNKIHYSVSQSDKLNLYKMSKENYFKFKDKDAFQGYLYANNREFLNSSPIFFKKKDSLPFPEKFADQNLIKIVVSGKRKEILEKIYTDQKSQSQINPYERDLRRFSKNNLILTNTLEDNNRKWNDQFKLLERVKIYFEDQEPDLSDIVSKYKLKTRAEEEIIHNKYNNEIKLELEKFQIEKLKQYQAESEKWINDKIGREDFQNSVKKDTEIEYEATLKAKKETNQSSSFYVDSKKAIYDSIFSEKKRNIQKLQELEINKKIALEIEKQKQILKQKYKLNRDNEIKKIRDYLKVEEDSESKAKIENETMRNCNIFFECTNEDFNKFKKNHFKYLIIDNSAERAKIIRHKISLENFYSGNVKNPYLVSYLFNSKELKNDSLLNNTKIENWFLDNLNAKQKEAVQKAIASNSIFLLQGPPGTGKTQVISEIVGQLIKGKNKKVLISSETHKAIDNVFDRLPKITDIRPIRLISDISKKESKFTPKYLVENFYQSIAHKMKESIKKYKNFQEYEGDYSDDQNHLLLLKQKINDLKSGTENLKNEINQLDANKKEIDYEIEKIDEVLKNQKFEIWKCKNTIDFIKNKFYKKIDDFFEDCKPQIFDFHQKLKNIDNWEIFKSYEFLKKEWDLDQITASQYFINRNKDLIEKNYDKQNILQRIDTNSFENKDEKIKLQKKLKEINDNLKQKEFNIDDDKYSLLQIFEFDFIANQNADTILSIIQKINLDLKELQEKFLEEIKNIVENINQKIEESENKRKEFATKKQNLKEEIIAASNSEDYKELQKNENKLKNKISKFIEKFNVKIDKNEDPIEQIQSAYKKLKENFDQEKIESEKKLPIYKKIVEYLKKEDVIKNDKKYYTKKLFEKSNFFGMTCTSRDIFKQDSFADLEEYGLNDIDIKNQDIDVVIIDEVSKSSFIDLLIPILHGKTIILVGDHRQLPPMYDLKNLKDEDFEKNDFIDGGTNKKYCEMYEECFFKFLFEQLSDNYKVMLNQQYRSHKHIMDSYNCFYDKKLEIGDPNLNQFKHHYLNIKNKYNYDIISQNKSVYFVNCEGYESRENDSFSYINDTEIDVVVELLKLIDEAYKKEPEFSKEKNENDDKRMSVGVISTYADQSRKIKRKIKNYQFKTFNENYDSRLIVSTVDDFQGDERDIIILSLVRNPEKRSAPPGFITAYQRINVALSRARRLLIVVGNRDYLEAKGIINLPSLDGNKENDKRNFHLYKEVIQSIINNGSFLESDDILLEKANNNEK